MFMEIPAQDGLKPCGLNTSVCQVMTEIDTYSSSNNPTTHLICFITDCNMETDVTYMWNDMTNGESTQSSKEECQSYCACAMDAFVFTWNSGDQKCYCKTSSSGWKAESGFFSGFARDCYGTGV